MLKGLKVLVPVAVMVLYGSGALALTAYLDRVNTNLPVKTYVTVVGKADTDSSYTFTVTPIAGVQLDQFYLNTDFNLIDTNFDLPGTWSFVEKPPVSADGFGKYDFSVKNGWSDSLTFTITGLTNPADADFYFLSDLPAGNGQGHFAAHIRGAPEFGDGITYFVRDGGGDYGGGGGAGSPVPEPTTMLLLGSGLIGLAGFGRRWGRKT